MRLGVIETAGHSLASDNISMAKLVQAIDCKNLILLSRLYGPEDYL